MMILKKQVEKPQIPTTEGIVRVPPSNIIDLRPGGAKKSPGRFKIPKLKAVLALASIILLVVTGILLTSNKPAKNTSVNYMTFRAQGVSFQYPNSYVEQPKTATGGSNSIVILSQSNPESVITVHLEKDADKSALAAKRNVLDDLELSASSSLPLTHPGFQKDSDIRLKIDGFNAADFAFHYTGKDKLTPVYVHFLIIPRGHDAYYVTVETVDKQTANNDDARIASTLKLP